MMLTVIRPKAIWPMLVVAVLLLGGASTATASPPPGPLVEVAWLEQHLHDEGLAILDIRSEVDDGNEVPFTDGHIPGSVHSSYTRGGWRVDRAGISKMLPPVEDLEQRIGGLGIGNDTTVIIVPAGTGQSDFGSAARVYWTFKVLGHDRVAILNGGYRAWVAAGHEIAIGEVQPWPTDFKARFQRQLLSTTDEVAQGGERGVQLVDARPTEHYTGEAKSSSVQAAGTIPGALSLPNKGYFDHDGSEPWRFLPSRASAMVGQTDLKANGRIVTFCNTGHRAATAWFALSQVLGMQNVGLYDGSMAAWTTSEHRPVQTIEDGVRHVINR